MTEQQAIKQATATHDQKRLQIEIDRLNEEFDIQEIKERGQSVED